MDFLIVEYWSFAFTVIVSFLVGLAYCIKKQFLADKFELLDTMNQQGHHDGVSNRRKPPRHANKTTQSTPNNKVNIKDSNEDKKKESSSELSLKSNETYDEAVSEISLQHSNPTQETEQCQNSIQTDKNCSTPTHVEDEQKPTASMKQRNRTKHVNRPPKVSSSKPEPVIPLKPQASVAPVKQTHMSSTTENSSNNANFSPDMHSKSNGHASLPHNIYPYSTYNSLPPRFQQQLLQKEAASAARRYRRRRGQFPSKKSSLPPGSAARSNDFIPSSFQEHQEQMQHHHHHQQQQQQQQQQHIEDIQIQPLMNNPRQQESSINNGYSSESDFLTDSPSTCRTHSISPLLSTSAGSQSSLQRLDLVRSLTTSHGLLDELISIFDSITFSSEEIQIILNKIAAKHISDKHDIQRLLSSTKYDKSFERIIDETYRSQAKILAIELQAEKNRVLELTQSNIDMENTMRQLQQHQQPNNMVQYEQMILSYQMQLRRLADENARLQHQLHAYSMMPATLNELKQQQHILNEQLRQLTIRNSALENEAVESERASKHAAEIYKKADTQKQERIEQMIADINKYKKLDKELTNFRQKHNELEKSLTEKIKDISQQRDEFRVYCNQLKEQVDKYEQLQVKYNKLMQAQSNNLTNQIQQEIHDLTEQNDEIRQQNWKIMEELNKSISEESK